MLVLNIISNVVNAMILHTKSGRRAASEGPTLIQER